MKSKLLKISDLIDKELEKVGTLPGPEWETRKQIMDKINRSEPQTDRILKKLMMTGQAERKLFLVDGKQRAHYKIKRT